MRSGAALTTWFTTDYYCDAILAAAWVLEPRIELHPKEGPKMADLKAGEYQSALKMLMAADGALQHAMSGVRRHEDQSVLRRRLEDVDSYIKKTKRELRLA